MKSLLLKILERDNERQVLLRNITRLEKAAGRKLSILDVGCGYGRNLKTLLAAGFQVTGVEANEGIVSANKKEGLPCLSVSELESGARSDYDVILMSHIVEHFEPSSLLQFMDSYLDRLRPGGSLVIATPLLSPYFYDDFDHVRPYQPTGILMVFGETAAQVQYQARNKLRLKNVWFRRSYYRWRFRSGLYQRNAFTFFLRATELLSALVHWASFDLVGRCDGWVGTFEKVGTSPRPKPSP